MTFRSFIVMFDSLTAEAKSDCEVNYTAKLKTAEAVLESIMGFHLDIAPMKLNLPKTKTNKKKVDQRSPQKPEVANKRHAGGRPVGSKKQAVNTIPSTRTSSRIASTTKAAGKAPATSSQTQSLSHII